MKITVSMTPTGAKIDSALKSLDLDGLLSELIEELGTTAEKEAKRFAPVLTGALRDSINFSPLTGIVLADIGYASFVHSGTRRMAGRPFMELGAREMGRGMDSAIKTKLEKELDDKLGNL